jgi:hypothetical protein
MIAFTASTVYMVKIHSIAITSWLVDIASRRTDVILEGRHLNPVYEDRKIAIKRYLEGEQPAHIYTSLGYSQTWFFKWKRRYELDGLDGLNDVSSAPHHQARQTEEAIETAIVNIRKCREKRARDDTKYALIGAVAIQKELQELGYAPPSAVQNPGCRAKRATGCCRRNTPGVFQTTGVFVKHDYLPNSPVSSRSSLTLATFSLAIFSKSFEAPPVLMDSMTSSPIRSRASPTALI